MKVKIVEVTIPAIPRKNMKYATTTAPLPLSITGGQSEANFIGWETRCPEQNRESAGSLSLFSHPYRSRGEELNLQLGHHSRITLSHTLFWLFRCSSIHGKNLSR
jgi:hypothetical protein